MDFRIENDVLQLRYQGERMPCEQWLQQWHLSRPSRSRLFQQRQILIRDQPVLPQTLLQSGDWLTLRIFGPQAVDEKPWDYPLRIVAEDELILAVSKPSGIIVHSDGTGNPHTLAHAVAHYYLQSGQHCSVRPLHRLDEGTSGILLFCKCPFFQPWFDAQMAQKAISRTYLALVEGALPSGFTRTVSQPIGRDRHQAGKMRISATGKPAQTRFEVIRSWPRQRRSLLRCQLKTGRTHQIRVHLASLGHPVVGDRLYGKADAERLMLHSWQCRWQDPLRECVRQITDPPAPEFGLL